jgi:hypothetical protein
MQLSNYPPGVSGFEDAITGGESSWYEVNLELSDDGHTVATIFPVSDEGSEEALTTVTGETLPAALRALADWAEATAIEGWS